MWIRRNWVFKMIKISINSITTSTYRKRADDSGGLRDEPSQAMKKKHYRLGWGQSTGRGHRLSAGASASPQSDRENRPQRECAQQRERFRGRGACGSSAPSQPTVTHLRPPQDSEATRRTDCHSIHDTPQSRGDAVRWAERRRLQTRQSRLPGSVLSWVASAVARMDCGQKRSRRRRQWLRTKRRTTTTRWPQTTHLPSTQRSQLDR